METTKKNLAQPTWLERYLKGEAQIATPKVYVPSHARDRIAEYGLEAYLSGTWKQQKKPEV